MSERRGRLPEDVVARVKAIPAPEVAAWLDLAPARERHKYACLWCDSSDALHAYEDGFKCYSCQQKGSVIDATMQRRGLDFRGAVEALASRFGVQLPEGGGLGVRLTPPVGYTQESRSSMRKGVREPEPAPAPQPEREAVYAAFWECCTLTPTGRAYVRERMAGYDAFGDELRSVEGRDGWRVILTALRGTFPNTAIQDAFGVRDDGKLALPFGGRVPLLVIPYRLGGRMVGVRFRNLSPNTEKKDRYRDLGGRAPAWPYRADDLCHQNTGTLHVVEGELNALTLAAYSNRRRVIGVPGVSRWRDYWTPYLRGASQVVLWYDADPAGDRGILDLATRWQEAFGKRWLDDCVQRQPMQGGDVNDLHQRDALAAYLTQYPLAHDNAATP